MKTFKRGDLVKVTKPHKHHERGTTGWVVDADRHVADVEHDRDGRIEPYNVEELSHL